MSPKHPRAWPWGQAALAEVFEDEKGQIGAVCYAGCDNRELWAAAVGSYLDTGPGAPRQGRDNADDYLIAVYQHPGRQAPEGFSPGLPWASGLHPESLQKPGSLANTSGKREGATTAVTSSCGGMTKATGRW